MKKKLNLPELILPALLIVSTLGSNTQVNSQGTHALTTSYANIIASRAKIDLTDLNGKPDAIIVATPVGNSKTTNPHPNGAWYYGGKWNFFNSDHITLVVGLTYNLTYFVNPGADQFLHAVTQQNLGFDGSYITHPKLDNNPNAQFAFFQNHSPDLRQGSVLNRFEEKIGYSYAAKKWYITNVSSIHPLLKGAYYNIVVSPGVTLVTTPILVNGTVVNTTPATTVPPTIVPATPTLVNGTIVNPTNTSSTQPCNCPTSLPPNGLAGGDLVGPYPDPMVRKILGRFLSNTAPAIGQVLKWNGTEWGPADDNAGAEGTTTPPSAPLQTFFKNGNNSSNVVPTGGLLPLIELTHTVALSKKSRLVISGMIDISGDDCFTCNTSSQGLLHLIIDGNIKLFLNIDVPAKTMNSATVSNFMIDLAPGTHTVRFEVKHSAPTSKLSVTSRHSSLMVIPIE